MRAYFFFWRENWKFLNLVYYEKELSKKISFQIKQ